MPRQYKFDASSFMSGVIVGLILKWTDMIPLIGGIAIGLSIRSIPEFVNINEFPTFIKQGFNFVKGLGEEGGNTTSKKK